MNGFNYGYYPQSYGYTQPQQMQPSQQQNERIWVQGADAARAYLVAPNGFARLWDSTQPVFYEKSADNTGRPFIETYEYKKREAVPQVEPVQANDLQAQIDGLRMKIENMEAVMKGGAVNVAESNAND